MKENVENGKKNTCGFGINDMPLWLFKELDTMSKEMYNNVRYVMLLDLYRKAQAYDMLVEGQMYTEQVSEEHQPDPVKEKEEEVKLFGGK